MGVGGSKGLFKVRLQMATLIWSLYCLNISIVDVELVTHDIQLQHNVKA